MCRGDETESIGSAITNDSSLYVWLYVEMNFHAKWLRRTFFGRGKQIYTMRRSKIVSPIHFVFATQGRLPLITEDIEQPLYRLLSDQARKMNAIVLAIGGMSDHVHIAVLFPGTESYAEFVKQLKGAASRLLKQSDIQVDDNFYWQAGYGAFGFSRSEINKVIAYIRTQKERHERRSTWPTLEETDEQSPLHVQPDALISRPASNKLQRQSLRITNSSQILESVSY